MVTSYGISLVRKNPNTNRYEILFIKKRISYAYITFVKGVYNKSNDNEIIKLFNNMTLDEKLCIKSLNFNIIWYKSYLSLPNNLNVKDLNKYEICKNKFEKRFLIDGGKRLFNLLKNTKNINLIWEMPKGMSNKNESEINAAIREFTEETNINKLKYRILYDERPIIYSFTDENTNYKYVYYMAFMLDNKYIPNIDISNESVVMEASDLKFLNTDEIKMVDSNKNFHDLVSKIISIVKKE